MWSLAGVLLLAGAWEIVGQADAFGRAWPPLTDVLAAFGREGQGEIFRRALVATGSRALRGYGFGVLLSLGLAVVALLVPLLQEPAYRLAVVVNSVPLIAIGPLLVATLPRETAPAAAATLAVFFSTFVAAVTGLGLAGARENDVFSVLGSRRRTRISRLLVPSALPTIVAGLKLAVPGAILGTILGEWFGADRGLGVLLLASMDNYRVDVLWATALLTAVLSMAVYGLLAAAEHVAARRYPRAAEFQRPPATRQGRLARLRGFLLPFWTVVAAVGIWQWWVEVEDVPRIVLPAPSSVFDDLLTSPSAYTGPAAATVVVAFAGLALGMVLGTVVAVLMSRFRLARAMLLPSAVMFQSIPIVVVIPLLARVLGYTDQTLVAVAAAMSFFPSFVLIESGLRQAPPGTEDVFSVLGARRNTRIRLLHLPSAVPNAFIALRISSASCVLGALTAEWLVGQHGLGHMFGRERARMGIDRAWGAVLVTTGLCVTGFLLASWAERWGRERTT